MTEEKAASVRLPGQDKKDSKRKPVRAKSLKSFLMFLGTFVLLMFLFISVGSSKTYDLHVGSICYETINATKDVVDEVTTEERRQAAANTVEPIYHFQEGVKEEVLSALETTFRELRTVQQYGLTLRDGEVASSKRSFSDEEIDYALNLIQNISLTRYQITTLLRIDTEVFDDMVSTVTVAVENSLNTTVREGQVSQSIQTILQIVGYKLDISLIQNILPTVLRACVKPNMIIDQEATEEARQKAKDAVEPVVFIQGQNIIRSGDRVTRSQLEMLRSLGLLNDRGYDYTVYFGALITVFLSLGSMLLLLRLLNDRVYRDLRRLSVLLLVIILGTVFSVIAHLLPSLYITPFTFAPILVTVLLGTRAGLASAIPMSVLIAGLASGSSGFGFYDVAFMQSMTILGASVAIPFLKEHPQRIRVLLAGAVSGVVNVIVFFSVQLLTSSESLRSGNIMIWSFTGGLLSGVLAMALQPVFETVFQLATPSKLMDLTNPNQPLMRRMLIEAPGTYHHSIIVANLAESAASRIGANPYLARAGGYYHDIGKLKRPGYFKENQVGENPHEKTDPYVSAAILTSHTHDGMMMAKKEHLPPEVQEIILQHHGDTPVMFFYHKALQMSNGSAVDISDFRYSGPRPRTREAAIVMLADTIEAAVRSMKDPTPKAINQFIEQLVRGRLEDGQLSDCPLTLRDLDDICDAFSAILKGVFHERIEYPKVSKYAVPIKPEKAKSATPPSDIPAHAAELSEAVGDTGDSGNAQQTDQCSQEVTEVPS